MTEQEDRKRRRDRGDIRRAGVGVMIPAVLSASIFVGAWLGWSFDKWLGTTPWGILVGLFLGIGAGVRETIRLLKKMNSGKDGED